MHVLPDTRQLRSMVFDLIRDVSPLRTLPDEDVALVIRDCLRLRVSRWRIRGALRYLSRQSVIAVHQKIVMGPKGVQRRTIVRFVREWIPSESSSRRVTLRRARLSQSSVLK